MSPIPKIGLFISALFENFEHWGDFNLNCVREIIQ